MDEIKVLIVDDDPLVLETLRKVAESNEMAAVLSESGEDAINKVRKKNFDCILLDINMKGLNGFEVIQKLRADGNNTPIIVVSGRIEDYDTIYGLKIGADDYITKPFNPVTLGAKIKATVRRSRAFNESGDPVIKAGPFTYNTSTLRLYKKGQEIVLTAKENAMMKLFIDNVNHIFPKDMLYEMIWGEKIVDEQSIVVYINRLRAKIEDDPSHPKYIQNARGLGYRFIV